MLATYRIIVSIFYIVYTFRCFIYPYIVQRQSNKYLQVKLLSRCTALHTSIVSLSHNEGGAFPGVRIADYGPHLVLLVLSYCSSTS